ncbi:Ribosome maturation factor RimP [Porphyridium purpureum]|uniref:Ribosome maturation factor RimP n=1 Tax=Porphyridium purpureum TaxID=35688 RepID=A0A5J4Z591_PORPP|nr:Ribosome maturation factor RimP [Porphyridium purpureum]|eukprot:POR8621..scf295_1
MAWCDSVAPVVRRGGQVARVSRVAAARRTRVAWMVVDAAGTARTRHGRRAARLRVPLVSVGAQHVSKLVVSLVSAGGEDATYVDRLDAKALQREFENVFGEIATALGLVVVSVQYRPHDQTFVIKLNLDENAEESALSEGAIAAADLDEIEDHSSDDADSEADSELDADSIPVPKGVSLERLQAFTQQVSERVEQAEAQEGARSPIARLGEFALEVSTPGVAEELTQDFEFAVFKGFAVLVETREEWKKKTSFEGALHERTESDIVLNLKGRLTKIPRDIVSRVVLAQATSE